MVMQRPVTSTLKWDFIKIATRPRFRPGKSGSMLSRDLALFLQCFSGNYFPACRGLCGITPGQRTLLESTAPQLFGNPEGRAAPACPPLLASLSLRFSQEKNYSFQLPLQYGVNRNLPLGRWGAGNVALRLYLAFLPSLNIEAPGLFMNVTVQILLLFKG